MMIFVHSGLGKACRHYKTRYTTIPPFCPPSPTAFVDVIVFCLFCTFQTAYIKLNLLGAFNNNNNTNLFQYSHMSTWCYQKYNTAKMMELQH